MSRVWRAFSLSQQFSCFTESMRAGKGLWAFPSCGISPVLNAAIGTVVFLLGEKCFVQYHHWCCLSRFESYQYPVYHFPGRFDIFCFLKKKWGHHPPSPLLRSLTLLSRVRISPATVMCSVPDLAFTVGWFTGLWELDGDGHQHCTVVVPRGVYHHRWGHWATLYRKENKRT